MAVGRVSVSQEYPAEIAGDVRAENANSMARLAWKGIERQAFGGRRSWLVWSKSANSLGGRRCSS